MKKIKKIFSVLIAGIAAMMVPTAAFGAEESLGSLMKEAGFNTILGIGTVFIMLIVISLIIYCFRFIPMIQKAFSKKKDVEEAPQKTVSVPAPAVAVQETDDLELVAVIAAAIAASEQVPLDSFVVRTIKRRK